MSTGQKPRVDGEAAVPVTKKMPGLCWCPSRLCKTQRHRLQKLRQVEIATAWEEAEHDAWFNQAHPIIEPKRTWREK
jgi:hypothetical protein